MKTEIIEAEFEKRTGKDQLCRFRNRVYAGLWYYTPKDIKKFNNTMEMFEIVLGENRHVTIYYTDKLEELEAVEGEKVKVPVIAYPDENERECILTDNANLFEIKYSVAKILQNSSTKVRVTHIGEDATVDRDIDAEICAAVLSKKLGLPVCIIKEKKKQPAYYAWEEDEAIMSVTTRLEEDGSYLILTSSVGGRHEQYLKLKEIAAMQFHTTVDKVTLQMGDTDYPYSANIDSCNIEKLFEKAIRKAAKELQQKIFDEVRKRWDVSTEMIDINESTVYIVNNPEKVIDLKTIGIESMFGTKKILSTNATAVAKKED